MNPIEFIDSVKWKFASTMRDIPHWYIVKDKLRSVRGPDVIVDRREFDSFIRHLRVNGRVGIWHGIYVHWYLHIRDHEFYYWTMGEPLLEVGGVNRARVENDDVRYLDEMRRWTPSERQLIDDWADSAECPECGSLDPFAQQWADKVLIGMFCSTCRKRFV